MAEQYEAELTAFNGESGEVRITFDIPRSDIDDGPVIRTGDRWTLTPVEQTDG